MLPRKKTNANIYIPFATRISWPRSRTPTQGTEYTRQAREGSNIWSRRLSGCQVLLNTNTNTNTKQSQHIHILILSSQIAKATKHS